MPSYALAETQVGGLGRRRLCYQRKYPVYLFPSSLPCNIIITRQPSVPIQQQESLSGPVGSSWNRSVAKSSPCIFIDQNLVYTDIKLQFIDILAWAEFYVYILRL